MNIDSKRFMIELNVTIFDGISLLVFTALLDIVWISSTERATNLHTAVALDKMESLQELLLKLTRLLY